MLLCVRSFILCLKGFVAINTDGKEEGEEKRKKGPRDKKRKSVI